MAMDETLQMVALISGGVVAFLALLLLGSGIGAVALRLAATILNFGSLPPFTAFKAALLANFVMLVLQLTVGLQYAFLANRMGYAMSRGMYTPQFFEMGFSFSPTFYLLATMFGLVTTALVFCRMLPTDKDNRLMNFRDALTLAAVYQAFTFAILILLGLIVFVLISTLMAL